MKKTIHTILLGLLTLVLLFGLLSATVSAAPAIDASVENEDQLIEAVQNAPDDSTSYIIELNEDISLTGSLNIPSGKNITLISGPNGPFALIGTNGEETIVVEGKLTLGTSPKSQNGIIVTHNENDLGRGVTVDNGGALILNCGEISGNTADESDYSGGGVFANEGSFDMFGGAISNNTVLYINSATYGGGVSVG